MRSAERTFRTLAALNAFVGAMVGIERSTLPLLARDEFGVATTSAALSFIVTFGLTKAVVNLLAGQAADRWGRKSVLVAGWLAGIPVPIAVILAPDWSWVVAANALLGVNQGLCWSMTLNMKLDLADASRRGRTAGINEFAGYAGLGVAAFAAGLLATSFGPRPAPFLLGLAIAVAGLVIALALRETSSGPRALRQELALAFPRASWRDPSLAAASAAGLATNLKDGVLWGLLPALLLSRGLPPAQMAFIVALYPAAWGVAQLVTGPLSDRVPRATLASAGLGVQAAGVLLFALPGGVLVAGAAALVAGLGTAMAYPTLLAFVSDRAGEGWRASALGVYRFWRDLGYAAGALLAGLLADVWGPPWALGAAAFLLGGAAARLALVRVPAGRKPLAKPS